MIYGQSGGGSKVTILMGMPSASGLFHRASAQSGGGGKLPGSEESKEFAGLTMKQLGIQGNDIAGLQKMEWSNLIAAGEAAAAQMQSRTGPFLWTSTLDGRIINVQSFYDAAPEISKTVPMLIGSVSEEGNAMTSRPTEEEWHANLAKAYDETRATAIVAALKKEYPQKSIPTLSYMCDGSKILNALSIRNRVARMAKMKYDLHAAPVYTYYFTWQTSIFDSIPGAWHTSELQFCFDNTKRCEQGTGNTPEAQALAKKMATAWANFARTGNPSQPGLEWTATNPETNPTMVWDNECRMVNDPEGELRKMVPS